MPIGPSRGEVAHQLVGAHAQDIKALTRRLVRQGMSKMRFSDATGIPS
jgi:hypothetical protein